MDLVVYIVVNTFSDSDNYIDPKNSNSFAAEWPYLSFIITMSLIPNSTSHIIL